MVNKIPLPEIIELNISQYILYCLVFSTLYSVYTDWAKSLWVTIQLHVPGMFEPLMTKCDKMEWAGQKVFYFFFCGAVKVTSLSILRLGQGVCKMFTAHLATNHLSLPNYFITFKLPYSKLPISSFPELLAGR